MPKIRLIFAPEMLKFHLIRQKNFNIYIYFIYNNLQNNVPIFLWDSSKF